MRLATLLLALGGAGIALAQVTARPVLSGFVFDESSRNIRPVVGVPGGAYLGGAAPGEFDSAWIAPGGDALIGVRNGKTVLVVGLSGSEPRELPADLLAAPTVVAWSPNGLRAALWAEGRMQRVTVGTSPFADAVRPVYLDAPVTAVAISSSGLVALGAGGSLYLVDGDSAPSFTARLEISALAFAGAKLYTGNSTSLSVFDTAGNPTGTVLADGLAVTAMVASMDEARVVALSPGRALVVSMRDGSLVDAPLEREFRTARLLKGNLVLLGPVEKNQPAMVLDVEHTPSVFFVPTADPTSL